MQKSFTMLIAAGALCLAGTFASEAAGMRPGWYAHSLLVYGNDGYERHVAGCLRWHYQQRAWYDHCVAARGKAITARY